MSKVLPLPTSRRRITKENAIKRAQKRHPELAASNSSITYLANYRDLKAAKAKAIRKLRGLTKGRNPAQTSIEEEKEAVARSFQKHHAVSAAPHELMRTGSPASRTKSANSVRIVRSQIGKESNEVMQEIMVRGRERRAKRLKFSRKVTRSVAKLLQPKGYQSRVTWKSKK